MAEGPLTMCFLFIVPMQLGELRLSLNSFAFSDHSSYVFGIWKLIQHLCNEGFHTLLKPSCLVYCLYVQSRDGSPHENSNVLAGTEETFIEEYLSDVEDPDTNIQNTSTKIRYLKPATSVRGGRRRKKTTACCKKLFLLWKK